MNISLKSGSHPARRVVEMYVGIDVAKGTHFARAMSNRDSEVTGAVGFSNNKKGFKKLVKQITNWAKDCNCERILIGMEPTADYWRPLFVYLVQLGYEVFLVSSLKVRRTKDLMDNSPLKSDKKDAMVIAKLVKEGNILSFRFERGDRDEIKAGMRHIEDIEKEIGSHRNHLEHYLSSHFPELSKVLGLRTVTLRRFLLIFPTVEAILNAGIDEVRRVIGEVSGGSMKPGKADAVYECALESIGVPCSAIDIQVLRDHLESLEFLHRALKRIEKMIDEPLERSAQYFILRSIDGVGKMCAAAIIADLGDLKSFENCRQVLKQAGLNLYNFSSGKKRGSDRISRRGSGYLRSNLYMAALRHTRKEGAYHEFYEKKHNEGKAFRKIMVAIMRKILKVAFALVRDDRVFEKNFVPGAGRNETVIRQAKVA